MALSPPPLDGPSIVALRAFEAAARLGSFSQAAVELRVTPAAIAQHVKAVEAWAQQPLFERFEMRVNNGVRCRICIDGAPDSAVGVKPDSPLPQP